LADAEFWHLTLAEFDALCRRAKLKDESAWRRMAMICCLTANINRDSKSKPTPFEIEDFMPGKRQKKVTLTSAQNDLAMRDMARMLNRCFGGVERQKE